MTTAKYLLYAALGAAAVLLLTSDKAKTMRNTLEDKARDKAKRWTDKMARVAADANDVVADLKNA